MAKRNGNGNGNEAKRDEHNAELFGEFAECFGFNAKAVRASAIWLNLHKQNAPLMKDLCAAFGRNFRNWARAVDWFEPHFVLVENDDSDMLTLDQYLTLFDYASEKHEEAIKDFNAWKFDYPRHVIHARILAKRAAARAPKSKRQTLAERIADYAEQLEHRAQVLQTNDDEPYNDARATAFEDISDELKQNPEVAAVLAARGKAEAKP